MGDLDGRVWRFDMTVHALTHVPTIAGATRLVELGEDQPILNSMTSVNAGGTSQYIFFGTGSDLLPSTNTDTTYHLIGVLDHEGSGSKTLDWKLAKQDGRKTDEKVTAFPAVAGDIVFFTTTTFRPSNSCKDQDANLYAFTFIGGPAYDSTGDGTVDVMDQPLVKTIARARATAPFIVDQHLMFGSASKVAVFGDPQDFNNGVGQAGVRILSWREVR
jgi:Tfp pilus tip-associated adhesin PilY1